MSRGYAVPGVLVAPDLFPRRMQLAGYPDRPPAAGSPMLFLAALSLASGALALLLSRAALLEPARARLPGLLRTGAECSFCVAFWTSLALVAWYGPPEDLARAPGLAVLATWGGAALVAGLALAPAD